MSNEPCYCKICQGKAPVPCQHQSDYVKDTRPTAEKLAGGNAFAQQFSVDLAKGDDTTVIAVNGVPLPRYKCHKEVNAVKIINIVPLAGGGAELWFDDAAVLDVDQRYLDQHKPQVSGYFVVYDDGYQSWSPADAFESGYTLMSGEVLSSKWQERLKGIKVTHRLRREHLILQIAQELIRKYQANGFETTMEGALIDRVVDEYQRVAHMTGPDPGDKPVDAFAPSGRDRRWLPRPRPQS